MPFKQSFFRKIVVLVFLLLIPVIILYSFSHHSNVQVIASQIRDANIRQLNFFLSQTESHMSQLALQSVTLSNENSIRSLFLDDNRSYGLRLLTKRELQEKLSLYSTSNPWKNDIAIFSPRSGESLYTYPLVEYEFPDLDTQHISRWNYMPDASGKGNHRFVWYTTDPPTARHHIETAHLIVEISFPVTNMVEMLDQFMTTRQGNPFFYSPGQDPIIGRKGDVDMVHEFISVLETRGFASESGHEQIQLAGEKYLVSYVTSKEFDWYLVDFVPLDAALAPVIMRRNFFYAAIALLLVTGIVLSFTIYRTVLLPIRELIHYVQKLKRGKYSERLSSPPNNEFQFLYNRFNEMAAQIQELIEKVYEQKIRTHEATVKQLQSQINPHFLYNCLFFIASMSRLGDREAVEAMANNLGEYYRHATRVKDGSTTLGEEISIVRNYLEIIQLRHKLEYEIRIPESMYDIPVPQLLLQPLAENAVFHGIEPSGHDGKIIIHGQRANGKVQIAVEDDGVGMDEAQLAKLQRTISAPMEEETGCGLWNVNQRLNFIYGEEAGIKLQRSELGGLKVTLTWKEGEAKHV